VTPTLTGRALLTLVGVDLGVLVAVAATRHPELAGELPACRFDGRGSPPGFLQPFGGMTCTVMT
jgi:hypothetical protein